MQEDINVVEHFHTSEMPCKQNGVCTVCQLYFKRQAYRNHSAKLASQEVIHFMSVDTEGPASRITSEGGRLGLATSRLSWVGMVRVVRDLRFDVLGIWGLQELGAVRGSPYKNAHNILGHIFPPPVAGNLHMLCLIFP